MKDEQRRIDNIFNTLINNFDLNTCIERCNDFIELPFCKPYEKRIYKQVIQKLKDYESKPL